MKVSINYTGGAHGHLLELICNHIFSKISIEKSRVTQNGTHHGYANEEEWREYRRNSIFIAFPFWWDHHDMQDRRNGLVLPHEFQKKVVNITATSLSDFALLRIYWRRRGDSFYLSPDELLNYTKDEVIAERKKRIPVNKYWPAGEILAQQVRDFLYDNLMKTFQNKNKLSEMEVINFWTNPFLHDSKPNSEWMLDVSKKFITEAIDNGHEVYEFKFEWFYEPKKFVEKIKEIGVVFGLKLESHDDEIYNLIEDLPKKIQEFPNIELVEQKFDAIKNKKSVGLTDLTLNDKIALMVMIHVFYDLFNEHFAELIEFPKVSDQFIEIIDRFKK